MLKRRQKILVRASSPFFHLNHSVWTGIQQRNADLLLKENDDDKGKNDEENDDDETNLHSQREFAGQNLDDDEETLANLLEPLGGVI
jgi:hypothetical protein